MDQDPEAPDRDAAQTVKGGDQLVKFLFEPGAPPASVRGEIVLLQHSWRRMVEHHDYPEPVRRLLGEMVAASALLSANLKFDGALVMQIHGDGPVRLLVVECNTDLSMRATAKLAEDIVVADDCGFLDLVNAGGTGRFAITLDPTDKSMGQQPYQGIVPLEGNSLAAVLREYMQRSQQIDTHLWLAADASSAGGVLLQRLPNDGGSHASVSASESDARAVEASETWERTVMLANTLNSAELLATDPQNLMHKLFWEETVRVFDPVACSFRCTCSPERVGRMLLSLGRAEVDDALAEQGTLRINCDFCNRRYEFDAVDCGQLFAQGAMIGPAAGTSGAPH